MKQTAVEWLEEIYLTTGNVNFKQAKKMEKELIKDAYDAGLFDGSMDDVNDRIHKEYYNETFKQD